MRAPVYCVNATMTYLEFQVEENTRSGLPRIGSARFVIDDENPRECVRKAVDEIRTHGWLPIMLREADYVGAEHDRRARRQLGRLFAEAAVAGYAFEIDSAVNALRGSRTPSRSFAIS